MNQVIKLIKYGDSTEAFEFQKQEITSPLADEVQIEVERFGLNYADVMARHGLYAEAPPLPCVLGYEVVGKITVVGADVSKDWIGKRVVAFTQFGGYSQQVNTKIFGVVEIGDYDGNKALSLATQYVTAYYMSHIATSMFKGDNILIHAAAGGVGTALIQLLKEKEVTIFAKTSRTEKEKYLKDLGVEHVINYKKSDYILQLKPLLNDKKIDVSFNPVGGAAFKKDWKILGHGGRMLLFGGSALSNRFGILSKLNFVRKMGLLLPIAVMMQSKSLIGINMLTVARNKPFVLQHCLSEVVRLAKEGKIDPKVGAVFQAKEIAKAHDFLGSGKSTGKVVVEW